MTPRLRELAQLERKWRDAARLLREKAQGQYHVMEALLTEQAERLEACADELAALLVRVEPPQEEITVMHYRVPHTFVALCGADSSKGVHWTTDVAKVTCPDCRVEPPTPDLRLGHPPKVYVGMNGHGQLIGVWATQAQCEENTKYYAECEIRGLRDAAASRAVPEPWQSIETAPKDSRAPIIVFDASYTEPVIPATWDDDPEDEGGQCWRAADALSDRLTPTLWCELPQRPTNAARAVPGEPG